LKAVGRCRLGGFFFLLLFGFAGLFFVFCGSTVSMACGEEE
jgi:hypothetical protein